MSNRQARREPSASRRLIVNADDFGQSSGINRGVAEAHERGIVTSASLMVRWTPAVEAAEYARTHPELSLGLHVDLGEWAYSANDWVRVYQVVAEDDVAGVAEAVANQLAAFRRLVGREPTHLDSHQHVHREEPMRSILWHVAHELRVPLREGSRKVRYCGDFYGQSADGVPFPEGISVENLLRILMDLRPGLTELGCHPGFGDDTQSMYVHERAQEVRALCDEQVRVTVKELGIELRGFAPYVEPLAQSRSLTRPKTSSSRFGLV